MNLKDLVRNVVSVMQENDVRKSVPPSKHTLYVSDEEGNTSSFVFKADRTSLLFNLGDVEAVLRTCLEVILKSIQNGDTIDIKGFGKLELVYREPRTQTGFNNERVEIAGRFIPRFKYGNELRRSAYLYQESLSNGLVTRIDTEGLIDDDEYEDID